MPVTITLSDNLAEHLQAQASAENLSVEDFAVKLLAGAIAQRSQSRVWETKNQRRVALIHKSSRDTLTTEEETELEQLQIELDRRLEHWDHQLLAELKRMEQAVEHLPGDGEA